MQREIVSSSNIVSIGYDKDSKTLEIEFRSGLYQYFDVPFDIYEQLMNAESKGIFHNKCIKNEFGYLKV